MVQPAALIVLTAPQEQKLTSWARAATTPQRLARRALQYLGRGTCIAQSSLVGVSPRRARPPLADSSITSWTRSRIVRRGACSGLSTTVRRIWANAPPKNFASVTRALSWCTHPYTRVG